MPAERARDDGSSLSLLTLLSRALLAFTIEFEREWELSLAISSNVLRVLDEKGVPLRGLPLLTGVSKEAVSMALGFLKERKYVTFAAVQMSVERSWCGSPRRDERLRLHMCSGLEPSKNNGTHALARTPFVGCGILQLG